MTRLADCAMDEALAQIEALNAVAACRRQRLDTDTRLMRLRALNARLTNLTFANGTMGGMQVFTHLWSVDNATGLRVAALIQGRVHQLDGRHGPALRSLARAAVFRREAMRRSASTQKAA